MMFTINWKCPKCKWMGTQQTGWDPLLQNSEGGLIRLFRCPSKKCAKNPPVLIGTKREETPPPPTPSGDPGDSERCADDEADRPE